MRVSRALSSTVRLALAMGRPESRGTGRAFSNVGGSKVMMGTDFILLIMPTLATDLLEKSCSHEAGAHNSTEPAAPLTAKSCFQSRHFLASLGILPSYEAAIVASPSVLPFRSAARCGSQHWGASKKGCRSPLRRVG